jgi:hypothetical protein
MTKTAKTPAKKVQTTAPTAKKARTAAAETYSIPQKFNSKAEYIRSRMAAHQNDKAAVVREFKKKEIPLYYSEIYSAIRETAEAAEA